MSNALLIEGLQEKIEHSELGQALLQHPLMKEDIWSLRALEFPAHELDRSARRNLYFDAFGLSWLKHLAKLTVLQRRNERHGVSVIASSTRTLRQLDEYLRQQGWSLPEDLCDSLLKQFIVQYKLSCQKIAQASLMYATRLWNEEGWLTVNYVPLKYQQPTPKVEALPEQVLHQFYENLYRFPSMLERLFRLQLALGWRIGALLQTPRHCLKQEGETWYLKRWIEKRKKWQFVQIHPTVAEVVQAQQRFLDRQFGRGSNFNYLFCWLSVAAWSTHVAYSKATRFEIEPVYEPKNLGINRIVDWLGFFAEEVGLQDLEGKPFHVTSHMLRRTKASIMAYCETEDEYIAAVLGHANLNMLPHYRQASLDRLEREAKQTAYVDMHGQVTVYKPKRTRYEHLYDRMMVHTQLGECHRPSMLGDCELRYACLNCQYHRVTVKDLPLLKQDQTNLLNDLDKAKSQGNTRKLTEISMLIQVINTRLKGLEEVGATMNEASDG